MHTYYDNYDVTRQVCAITLTAGNINGSESKLGDNSSDLNNNKHFLNQLFSFLLSCTRAWAFGVD
jgi:hypothetical protein